MKDNETTRDLMLQIIRTRMTFRQTMQRILKRNNIEITFEMLQIMYCLWQEEGISQQVLAEKTSKDKACLTNLMSNLEKKGWILRKESTTDRRNRAVFLTPEGKAMNERILPLIHDLYSQAEQQMDIDEIKASINLLQKMDEVFNAL